MSKKIDMMGKRFGKLLVVEQAESSSSGQARWVCKCDCGNTTITLGHSLRSGRTLSCGCTRNEKIANLRKTHGESNTRLFKIWMCIKHRCNRKTASDYNLYGGRGISICDEWLNDYAAFRDWSIANGYSDNLSLDRIDPNGNYEPSNCRWADAYTQAENRRNAHIVEYHGETGALDPMCRKLNINSKTVRTRMSHFGISFQEAVDGFSYRPPFKEYWK